MTRKRSCRTIGDAASNNQRGIFDAPTDGDHQQIRTARYQAQAQFAKIMEAHDAAVLAALRAELGAIVRSASPLLISFLTLDGLSLDGAMALFRPKALWPRHPQLSGSMSKHLIHTDLRHHLAGARPAQLSASPLHCHNFNRPGGGFLTMQVVDHSVELNALVGSVFLQTRFGELRVELVDRLPEIIFMACVGRMLEELVDHVAWRGQGWRIIATEGGSLQTLIVAVGSMPYQVTWPEPAGSGT